MKPDHRLESVMFQLRNFINWYSDHIYTTIDDVTYTIQSIKTNIMNKLCHTIILILRSDDEPASELSINVMAIENHIDRFNSQNNTMSFDILVENSKKHYHYVKQLRSYPFNASNTFNEIINYFIHHLTYIVGNYHRFNQRQKEGER